MNAGWKINRRTFDPVKRIVAMGFTEANFQRKKYSHEYVEVCKHYCYNEQNEIRSDFE